LQAHPISDVCVTVCVYLIYLLVCLFYCLLLIYQPDNATEDDEITT